MVSVTMNKTANETFSWWYEMQRRDATPVTQLMALN